VDRLFVGDSGVERVGKGGMVGRVQWSAIGRARELMGWENIGKCSSSSEEGSKERIVDDGKAYT
jgi:hypothetical protein